jgi:hypothetical protein
MHLLGPALWTPIGVEGIKVCVSAARGRGRVRVRELPTRFIGPEWQCREVPQTGGPFSIGRNESN